MNAVDAWEKRRPRVRFRPEMTACTSEKCPYLFRETVNLMATFAVKTRCQPAPNAALERKLSMRKTTDESGEGMGKTPSAHAVYAGNDSLYFRKVSLFIPRNSIFDGQICCKNRCQPTE